MEAAGFSEKWYLSNQPHAVIFQTTVTWQKIACRKIFSIQ